MGMFPQARGARTGHWLNVHSLYFQLLSETGLLGIFAFVCYLISTYLTNRHLQAELMHIKDLPGFLIGYPLACNLCIAALLFAGWGSHSLYRETWYFLGGLSAALGGILCDLKVTVPKKKKREKSKTANMKIRALEVKA